MQLEKILEKYSSNTDRDKETSQGATKTYFFIVALLIIQVFTISWVWSVEKNNAETSAELKRQTPLVYANCS